MSSILPLIHVTDVGATQKEGVDSLLRIKKQYARLGHAVDIIPAGHSPLHVAFVALTDLSTRAQDTAYKIRKSLQKHTTQESLVIALNCAPRNNEKSVLQAQESYMYRIQTKRYTYILYGPAVLEWAVRFLADDSNITCESINSISPYIDDTSLGSQFRSAEYLPIAHVLEAHQSLSQNIQTTPLDLPDKTNFEETLKDNHIVVLPPDEYHNTRLLFHTETWNKILQSQASVHIKDLFDQPIAVCQSLTEVQPDIISLWPSSNHLPNQNLSIVNMGTRWKAGTTTTTHAQAQTLAQTAIQQVGNIYPID